MHRLALNKQRLQGVEVIQLAGAIEPFSFGNLEAVMNKVISEGCPCIILECRNVAHFGTVELKQLLNFARHARACGGDVKCVGLPKKVRQIAQIIANGDLMDCYDELMEALAAFHKSPEPALV